MSNTAKFKSLHAVGYAYIVTRSLDKLRNFKKRAEFIQDPKYNQLALAFWTCLQLERYDKR